MNTRNPRRWNYAVCAVAILTCGILATIARGEEDEPKSVNSNIQKLLDAKKISFDPSIADANALGVEAELATAMKSRVELGGVFFTCKDKAEFLKAWERLTGKADKKEHLLIGWFVPEENRYVGPEFSKTPEQIEEMTDEDFNEWRKGWDIDFDRSLARFSPTPSKTGKLTDSKCGSFAITRALLKTTDKDIFLKQVSEIEAKAKKNLVFGVYQKCEMVVQGTVSIHSNSINFADIEDLSKTEFKIWRKRFLRFIDLQSPGQSQVKLFVRLSAPQFAAHLAQIRGGGTLPSGTIRFGISLFEKWSGIHLKKPNYATTATEAVIESVKPDSPGEKAGLQAGNVILEVEGSEVAEWDDFIFVLSSFQEGSKIALLVETDPNKMPEKKYYRVDKRLPQLIVKEIFSGKKKPAKPAKPDKPVESK